MQSDFRGVQIQPLGLDTSGISIDTIQTGDLRDPLSGEQWGAVWVEINDAMAADHGDHKIRINVVERLHPDTGETMYDIPEIELTKVTISDQEHTPTTASINASIKTYNILDAEFQTLIDAGEFNHDSEVSQDFGNGITTYSVSNWQNNRVKGNGVWILEFSCPFENWYNSIHND